MPHIRVKLFTHANNEGHKHLVPLSFLDRPSERERVPAIWDSLVLTQLGLYLTQIGSNSNLIQTRFEEPINPNLIKILIQI